MKAIGILGSGAVGKTLADGFSSKGYRVMVGTSHPNKLEKFRDEHPKVLIGSFAEAAEHGHVLVLALKGTAVRDLLKDIDPRHLKGKVVIDATNPISEKEPTNGVLHFFTDLETSLMEKLQSDHPDVRFVKAFNSIGHALMVDPDLGGVQPSMFFCGNDDDAKKEVREILEHFGFVPEDMGKAEAARAIEPLCMLWCIPGFLNGEWNHAISLIRG
ncbi:MAG: NAD(P)-binding domain-containing protein [Bacteroidota bacterium]|nr:NAD(P)-binding domain-containing protein [Bacteroidota bacterium]MDX5427989.1 NAD(P)-binding domain-containing protein [Bacteroidota bacterium]MDX5505833.1 NAD(P)-binding domain-containing protein [Bacteroidota bacterium]